MDAAGGWTTNDEAAVAEARRGNAEAYRLLVERHSRSIFKLAFRMTGNQHDAEDLVQETFLRACKQLDRFDGRAGFGTWLYRIAANCSVDLIRSRTARERKQVSMHRADDDATDPLEAIAGSGPSPERLTMSGEIARLVRPAMAQLSKQERAAFVLRHYEGRSIEEISEILNVRPNAAKHSIFRAVQKLRRTLEPALGKSFVRSAG